MCVVFVRAAAERARIGAAEVGPQVWRRGVAGRCEQRGDRVVGRDDGRGGVVDVVLPERCEALLVVVELGRREDHRVLLSALLA